MLTIYNVDQVVGALSGLPCRFITDKHWMNVWKLVRGGASREDFLSALTEGESFYSDCYFFALLVRSFLIDENTVSIRRTTLTNKEKIKGKLGDTIMIGTSWESPLKQLPDFFYCAREHLVYVGDDLWAGFVALPNAAPMVGTLVDWEEKVLENFARAVRDPEGLLTDLNKAVGKQTHSVDLMALIDTIRHKKSPPRIVYHCSS